MKKLCLSLISFILLSTTFKNVYAAPTFINSWVNDARIHSTSDFSIAQAITPTSGNLLLLFVTSKQDLATTPSISGWTSRGFKCTSLTTACIYSYSKLATGSETVTVVLDNQDNPNSATLSILEYSGALNFLHNSAVSNGTGSALTTNTVSTSNNNELLIAVAAVDANVSHGTWSNSFIQRVNQKITGSNLTLNSSVVDLTTNNTGSYSTETTLSKSESWATMIFNFDTVESSTSDLVLSKTVSTTNPSVFQNFTYTLSVYNSGPADNNNVQVTDTMPALFTLVSTTPSAGTTYNRTTGIWDIGSLPAGQTKTLSIIEYANTLASGLTITNTANITSYAISDPDASNNTSTSTITVKPVSSSPYINAPIVAGATSVSGTSSGSDGTTINVYNGATLIGTTTVSSNVWTANVLTVSGGDSITATATVAGGTESSPSSPVIVLFKSAIPIITVPVYAGSTSLQGITGEADGTVIEVFLDNVLLGTTTSSGGSWTLSVPSPTLISTHVLKVRATAPGKYVSDFSANVTIVDAISPVPSITSSIVAGDTFIEGHSVGPDGTLIEVFKRRSGVTTSIGFGLVSSNVWYISGLNSSEIRSGDIITAKARIDTNNDGLNNSSDVFSSSSTEITAVLRVSQIPTIDQADTGETILSGTSTGQDGTLIKIYKNNTYSTSTTVSSNLWSIATSALLNGDEYKATATFDNNNDGVIDGSDTASAYSSTMTVNGTPVTDIPTVNQPIEAGSILINGESNEANGTTIELFIDSVLFGTTSVLERQWQITLPSNTLQTGEKIKAKASASGKLPSGFSSEVTVVSQYAPTPTVNELKAGDTNISGVVIAPDGSVIEVFIDMVMIGTAPVSSNAWNLDVASTTLQTGESVRAETHIDYDNDGIIELDDSRSSLSTEVIVTNRISPIPILDPIGFNTKVITGSLTPVAVTKIYVYRFREGVRTLLGVTQTNSPTFFLDEIISNPWVLGDSITATSITDTNNDGVVDNNDLQSSDSEPEIIFDDSIFQESTTSKNCEEEKPNGIPLIYKIEVTGATELKVFFNPLNQPRDKFEFEYINNQSTFKRGGIITNYIKGYFTLTDLFEGNSYKIRIRAVNGCKKGEWSEYKYGTPNAVSAALINVPSKTSIFTELFKKPFESEPFKTDFIPEATSPVAAIDSKINETKTNNLYYLFIAFGVVGLGIFIYRKFFIK